MSALCRSRRELSNAYFLAKFRFDTAENESCKVCRIPWQARSPTPRGRGPRTAGAPRRRTHRRHCGPPPGLLLPGKDMMWFLVKLFCFCTYRKIHFWITSTSTSVKYFWRNVIGRILVFQVYKRLNLILFRKSNCQLSGDLQNSTKTI